MEITMALEERFNLATIPDEQVEMSRTVDELLRSGRGSVAPNATQGLKLG